MTDDPKLQTPRSRIFELLLPLGSWLFLFGSLIFQLDSIWELMEEGLSIHVFLDLFSSVLFTLGSVLFVIHDMKS